MLKPLLKTGQIQLIKQQDLTLFLNQIVPMVCAHLKKILM
ncbi:hypothetical protein GCWU000324_01590 [Kingella oralis ATCC 51147]|uniref:Uncharacterized protein n=1 Tax=Kingella oralis ATCC 51147 TaxID=629741 RepID=C4GKT4_9NEIS|nr:hypothetical protein GCWU000324_01590 [Kingella oralis ATCC 51147]